jgi:hypothetical protein
MTVGRVWTDNWETQVIQRMYFIEPGKTNESVIYSNLYVHIRAYKSAYVMQLTNKYTSINIWSVIYLFIYALCLCNLRVDAKCWHKIPLFLFLLRISFEYLALNHVISHLRLQSLPNYCTFHCILFRYSNLFSFAQVCQFQSVQFFQTLFHLLSIFLSFTKSICSTCISPISFHFRKVVLRVKIAGLATPLSP